MVDHIVDASEPRGRVDIRIGVGRRRRWSVETKGRVVANLMHRHGGFRSGPSARHLTAASVCMAQGSAQGRLTLPVDAAMPMFVPVVTGKGADAVGGRRIVEGSGLRSQERWYARNPALSSAG